MKKIIFTLSLLLLSNSLFAQQTIDSTQAKPTGPPKEKFPTMRPFNFDYNQSLSRNFDSEFLDEDFGTGDIKNQKNFNASANILLKKTQKWIFLSNLTYRYTQFEFENVENATPTIFEQNGTVDYHYFSTGFTSINISTLFKKLVVYNSSIFVDGDNNDIQRLKAALGFSLFLKRTQETTIGIGLQGFIDPAAQLPIIPTFIYKHKFDNSKWEIDAIIPRYAYFRRFVGENARLSIGSTFGPQILYTTLDSPSFNGVFNYTQLTINSGIQYEYRINDNVNAHFSGGLQSLLNSRLTEKGDSQDNYIYENTQKATGYFKLGISIDPFTKKK